MAKTKIYAQVALRCVCMHKREREFTIITEKKEGN